MKPLLLTICALLCLQLTAYGQEDDGDFYEHDTLQLGDYDEKFIAGILVGGNTGNLHNDYFGGYHNIGYSAGLTVYVRLGKHFWVNGELLYVRKGCTGVRSAESLYWGTYFEKYYLRLNYAEVPVLFHLFQRKWYHLSFGASYARYLNSTENLYTSPDRINVNQELFYFNKNNFDYILGGGLHLNQKLYLNVRFQSSLVPVRNAYYVHPATGAGNQYLTTFSLQLMYLFRNIAR
ncbi:MAG: PorT family protein [Flavipsychrobacter sp.]|nr:PorT family protein [Flavipsychrobacter sp.]